MGDDGNEEVVEGGDEVTQPTKEERSEPPDPQQEGVRGARKRAESAKENGVSHLGSMKLGEKIV